MQENKLADGNLFEFWEKDVNYIHTLYVACDASNASDNNDGSITAPLKTIQVAADQRVEMDILGNERQAGGVVPGPFAELEFDKVYYIDPRK